MNQYTEIISASDAWLIANDDGNDDDAVVVDRELRPTNSARRVKALVEQVTGKHYLVSVSIVPIIHFVHYRSLLAIASVYAAYALFDRGPAASVGILSRSYISIPRRV